MPEIKSSDPYGCHNRQAVKEAFFAQDGSAYHGWQHHKGGMSPQEHTRIPIYKVVQHRMTKTCQYDKSGEDLRCSGCIHHNQDNAAKYAQKDDGSALSSLIPGWTAELWVEFKEWNKARKK